MARFLYGKFEIEILNEKLLGFQRHLLGNINNFSSVCVFAEKSKKLEKYKSKTYITAPSIDHEFGNRTKTMWKMEQKLFFYSAIY